MIFKPSHMQFKKLNCQISTSFKQFFFFDQNHLQNSSGGSRGGGGQFLGQTEARRAEKFFGDRLRPPPPPLFSKGLDDCPPLVSRFGSGPEYPWIAIIKTKSATIAVFSSPPVRFSSLFLLFFSFSFAGAGIIELIRRKKPTLWPFFNQMAVNFVRFVFKRCARNINSCKQNTAMLIAKQLSMATIPLCFASGVVQCSTISIAVFFLQNLMSTCYFCWSGVYRSYVLRHIRLRSFAVLCV